MDNDAVERLCQAIIVRAAKDYRWALRTLKRNPSHQKAQEMKHEVEGFFRSDWYEMMTNVEGEYLIRKLREEFQ